MSRRGLLWAGAAVVAAVAVVIALVATRGGGPGESAGSSTTRSTAEESTTAASTTAAPTTLPPAAGYVTVTDATGTLRLAVPGAWAQTDVEPLDFLGASRPHVSATSDLAGYVNSWLVPGISVIAIDRAAAGDATTLLDAVDYTVGYSTSCVFGAADVYADARFGGEIRAWSNCEGSGNTVVAVAADDGGGVLYLAVVIAFSDQDLAALQQALATVAYTG